MGLQIEDGSNGTRQGAGVNSDGHLEVSAITQTEGQFINTKNEKVWSIPFEGLNPAGADDYVVYIKNTGNKVMHISDIRIMADTAATQIEINSVTGTAAGGSAITPVPRTVGSAQTPTATIESGTDITGLTSTGTIFFIQCDTVNREYHLRTSSKIRLPKGQAIGVLVETATANVTGVISIIEEQ